MAQPVCSSYANSPLPFSFSPDNSPEVRGSTAVVPCVEVASHIVQNSTPLLFFSPLAQDDNIGADVSGVVRTIFRAD